MAGAKPPHLRELAPEMEALLMLRKLIVADLLEQLIWVLFAEIFKK